MRDEAPAPRLALWVAAGLALDLAAWAGLRRVGVLTANPGLASAAAICLVHGFVLPSLYGAGRRKMLIGLATGCAATPVAVSLGIGAGIYTECFAFLLLAGFSPASGADVPYNPPGPILGAVEDACGVATVWSGLVIGPATAAVVAGALAAIVPGLRRPPVGWRLFLTGACAAVIFLPDWDLPSLAPPWREPALLLAAALPNLLLIHPSVLTETRR